MPTASRISLALLLLVLPAAAVAQPGWQVVEMIPGVYTFDLCMLPDGLHGWSVGGNSLAQELHGVIFRTVDGGLSWEPCDFPFSPTVVLQGASFVDEHHGWVVGSGGRVFMTSDGGDSWTAQASGVTVTLNDVCFIDTLRGWITGAAGAGSRHTVLRTADGGAHWENLSFGSTSYSNLSIAFVDENQGWMGGWDSSLNPHIHHTEDGGVNWVRQSVPVPSGAGSIAAIDFVSTEIGWASVSSLYQSPRGAILHTTDGGDIWNVQTYTNRHYNDALDAQDELHCAVAAVDILGGSERVFVTENGGTAWNAYTPPIILYTYGLQYVGDQIWIGAQYSAILRSPNDGVDWQWQNYAPLWSSICWSTPQTGWLVAGSYALTDGYCLHTTNGGHTWFRDEDAPGGSQVQFVDPDHGWMFFEGNSARIWRTVDAGVNWTPHSVAGGGWIEAVQFIDPQRGWAFGSNGTIKRTDDGGVSWSYQSSGTGDFVSEVQFVSPEEGWAAGGYGGGSGFIRHSTNGGDDWLAQTPAYPHHFQCLDFVGNQHGWLGAVGGYVHHTSDGGVHWSINGQVPHDYLIDIEFRDQLEGWLLARNHAGGGYGEDGRGFIYHTTDGGTEWTLEWEAPWINGAVLDFSFAKDGTPWVVGAHHTMLVCRDPATTPGSTPPPPPLQLSSASPSAASVQLGYLLDRTTPVRLSIYDASGRLTRTLLHGTQGAGWHEVLWDRRDGHGRTVPSGVYYARLQVAEGGTRKTITLLR